MPSPPIGPKPSSSSSSYSSSSLGPSSKKPKASIIMPNVSASSSNKPEPSANTAPFLYIIPPFKVPETSPSPDIKSPSTVRFPVISNE